VQIAGATVLLTGASGGIGHAVARSLAERGGRLILSGRRPDVLESLARELDARAVAADLVEPAEVDRLVREAGEVDILVSNAALPGTGTLESFTVEQIDRALAVNLRAPIALSRALVPGMIARRHGHLAFMSSLNGKAATPRTLVYNATKFGLRGFAAGLRIDLREHNVGVSAVSPGFVSDAGIFASSGAKLPFFVKTSTPDDVARATVRAIERNRGEVDVAPLTVRLGSAFAGIAPEAAASVSRRLGADRIAAELASGTVEKR
jgi:short-subunit dehydrogenase